MKNKLVKKIGAIMMSVLVSIPALSISGTAMANDGVLSDARLWTTYYTYSVIQDPKEMEKDYVMPPEVLSENENLKLTVKMGRGESENAQLIITPKKDVSSYSVKVSDLTCGENVIPKEDIDIFNQYYSYIPATLKNCELYVPTGMTPDYLIPMDWAIKVGENKIKAGNNQGITFEIETKVDTVPGTYTGTVELTLNNKTQNIPLVVTVKDVDLSKSLIPVFAASFGEIQDRSAYEKLLNYRVEGQFMFHGNYSPDAMVAELRRYYNEPRFGGYELPNVLPDIFGKYLRRIAMACDEDNVNYLERAYVYMQNIDEAHDLNTIYTAYAQMVAQKNAVKAELNNLMPNSSEEFIAEIRDAITNITMYHAAYVIDWKNTDPAAADVTNCYNYYDFGTSEEIDKYYSQYSAQKPLIYTNNYFPAMANSAPNYGQSNRFLGWAQAKFDYDGMLFWGANEITTEMTDNRGSAFQYRVRNYYDNQNSWSSTYGNACYTIPAGKYGYPLDYIVDSTIVNVRDAVEDYTLIDALEKLYNELSATYGVEEDFDNLIDFVYKKAFYNHYTYLPDSGRVLFEMRDIIYDLIDLAKSPAKFMTALSKIESDKISFSFYADADSVKVNGTTVNKNEGKYTYTWALNDSNTVNVEMTKDGEEYNFNAVIFNYGTVNKVTLTQKMVEDYVESSPAGGRGYIPEGTAEFNATNESIKISIPTCEGTALQIIGYVPRFMLDSRIFNVTDMYDVAYISMKIRIKYKSGDPQAVVPLTVRLNQSAANSIDTQTFVFDKDSYVGNGWHERYITFRIDKYNIQNVKALSFTFDRTFYVFSQVLNMGADVEISDINYTLCEYPNKGA